MAAATRLTEPLRTSPMANIPGLLVWYFPVVSGGPMRRSLHAVRSGGPAALANVDQRRLVCLALRT
jgi:hypothetical protein